MYAEELHLRLHFITACLSSVCGLLVTYPTPPIPPCPSANSTGLGKY